MGGIEPPRLQAPNRPDAVGDGRAAAQGRRPHRLDLARAGGGRCAARGRSCRLSPGPTIAHSRSTGKRGRSDRAARRGQSGGRAPAGRGRPPGDRTPPPRACKRAGSEPEPPARIVHSPTAPRPRRAGPVRQGRARSPWRRKRRFGRRCAHDPGDPAAEDGRPSAAVRGLAPPVDQRSARGSARRPPPGPSEKARSSPDRPDRSGGQREEARRGDRPVPAP